MNDAEAFTERLRSLIERDCRFYGRDCRIVELLAGEAQIVLEIREATPPIQPDQYGQAVSRSYEHVEVSLFDDTGELSEDLMHLLDGVREPG